MVRFRLGPVDIAVVMVLVIVSFGPTTTYGQECDPIEIVKLVDPDGEVRDSFGQSAAI